MKQNYEECLAKRSHGKWKSALGHTLFIIGMVLVSLGAFAQQQQTSEIPDGLKMKKQWIPNADGTSGKVVLETYVTGASITTNLSIPNDIVLVVDQSGSMDENFGSDGKSKLEALRESVDGFITNVFNDAKNTGADHKIALVGFASGTTYYTNRGTQGWIPSYYDDYVEVGNYYYYNKRYDWENTELLSTQSPVAYGTNQAATCQITTGQYQDALVTVNNNGSLNSRLNNISDRIEASGGTCMQYGLEMAYGVLSNRTVTTFDTPEGPKPRGQIVIFFTDGYPGMVFPKDNNNQRVSEYSSNNVNISLQSDNYYHLASDLIVSKTVADASITQANNLKTNGATIYSVGIFDGASPTTAYQTTLITNQSNGNNSYRYDYWNAADAAANGVMHMISSNYDNKPGNQVAPVTSWSGSTTSSSNVANRFVEYTYTVDGEEKTWKPKYFSASNLHELSQVFESIAEDSGAEPIEMSAQTLVQDEVSSSYTLPEGANINDIEIYAVKCTAATVDGEGNVTSCEFNTNGADVITLPDGTTVTFGTKTTYADDETTILYLPMNNGVVDEDDNLPENRLDPKGPDGQANTDDDLVQIINNEGENQTIKLTGFDFTNMFCGLVGEHPNEQPTGRKLVIMIPIEAAPGVWGDGIVTNGPMSFVLPDGSQVAYSFECPTANVMGEVWTEVVNKKPEGYSDDNIDSPEDLAWFISRVNGRAGYPDNDTCWSHPTINGKLTADIDMSAHNWVPIGAGFKCANGSYVDANGDPIPEDDNTTERVKLAYDGEFDGNGHVITGLKNNASKFYKIVEEGDNGKVVVFPGMFSTVTGTVHDVFILDSDFRGKHHTDKFVHHGILCDTLTGGTIYNCEAAGRLTCNNDKPEDDKNLIYGGLVGLNNGGTIYNCMAMAELTGYTMGGAVGENRSGSFSNGFTNGKYDYIGTDDTYKVGGLAASNGGTINNCYVEFDRINSNLDIATFDMLCADGSTTNCYIPQIVTWSRPSTSSQTTQVTTNTTVPTSVTAPGGNPTNSYTLSVNKTFYNMFTNDNMTDGEWGTLGRYNVYDGTPLVDKLNENKGTNGASWKRTTAGNYDVAHGSGNINGDYPVLQLPGYNCLGSADGIRIDYAKNLSDMLHRHNSGALNEKTGLGDSYKKTDHAAINGGTINLFANDDNRSTAKAQKEQNTDDNVMVYIDENISLLQDESSSIDAYTGQTLESFIPEQGERWHFVSSSLKDSQFGISYGISGHVGFNGTDEDQNPCNMSLSQVDEDHALFPIDLVSYRQMDFYCFFEEQYHWINFKRNSASHHHMDGNHDLISYNNETSFVPGKGYLLSVNMETWASYDRNAQFLQNRGTLNNGNNISFKVTAKAPEWTGLKGYNLIGNPYQSYLDFEAFKTGNPDLWTSEDVFAYTYAVYDPKSDSWLQYASTASQNEEVASRYINMHQGFMIRVSKDGAAKFTNTMRVNDPGENYPGFRGTVNYPLINFILDNGKDAKNVAVLELGRPENGGAEKLNVGSTKGRISLRHDNQDFGILFRDITEGSQPLYFDTDEDGTFTLSWSTANANFSSLTLVDNLTGVRYDMLANDSYSFEGKASDYRSRFKVVIGRFTDVEENEETVTDNFAFFDGSDWIVNGQGQLTVTDMTGRTVYTSNLTNDQNRVSLNGVANGIYLMRVANGQNVNVQKIVVR